MTVEAFLQQNIEGSSRSENPPFWRTLLRLVFFVARSFYYGCYTMPFLLVFLFVIDTYVGHLEWLKTAFVQHPRIVIVLVLIVIGTPVVRLKSWYFPERRDRIRREYLAHPERVAFSASQYADAAQLLRNWRASPYSRAIEAHPKVLVDLLILAGALDEDRYRSRFELRRTVSIRSIEEDREATGEDDVEDAEQDK